MPNPPAICINGRTISSLSPIYIIAEIGVNHNGSEDTAHTMIDAALASGADAVKFQTFLTDEVLTENAQTAEYQKLAVGASNQKEMVRKLELPFEAFSRLRNHCHEVGIDFISTAFDEKSLDFVVSLKPACLKWPSGEITNLPLLRKAVEAGLPIVLSSGMASIEDIARAVETVGSRTDMAILQCVSNYPARIEDQNLRAIPSLGAAFNRPVGFSDHTLGPHAAIAAAALGMCVWEKHVTLDRSMHGPDHKASSEFGEFTKMVQILRQVEVGLGDGYKRVVGSEREVRAVARKSLVYSEDLQAGQMLAAHHLVAKRPADGISPQHSILFHGQKLRIGVRKDQRVQLSDFG